MLTSTNYDDDVIRNTGGTNGVGVKAVNILSK
jgi:DNA gyrase/topoisomerase IV subunit B